MISVTIGRNNNPLRIRLDGESGFDLCGHHFPEQDSCQNGQSGTEQKGRRRTEPAPSEGSLPEHPRNNRSRESGQTDDGIAYAVRFATLSGATRSAMKAFAEPSVAA